MAYFKYNSLENEHENVKKAILENLLHVLVSRYLIENIVIQLVLNPKLVLSPRTNSFYTKFLAGFFAQEMNIVSFISITTAATK